MELLKISCRILELLNRIAIATAILFYVYYPTFAQQQPNLQAGFEPRVALAAFRSSADPSEDLNSTTISPALTLTKSLPLRFAAHGSLKYVEKFGDIEPYKRLTAGVGLRYYPKFKSIPAHASSFQVAWRKRLGLYCFTNYRVNLLEDNPENNFFKDVGSGLVGGLGFNIFFSKQFALEQEIQVFSAGQYWNRNIGISSTVRLAFGSPLKYWPEINDLASNSSSKGSHVDEERFVKPCFAIFLEPSIADGFGRRILDDPDEPVLTEHHIYYSLGGGVILPKGFEVGLNVRLLDAIGSVDDVLDVSYRDQYYMAGIFARYDIPVYNNRVRLLAQLDASYSNYSYLYNTGHRKISRTYVGFAPILRYVIYPQVYLSGVMNFNLTTDNDRNSLAANFPEISVMFVMQNGKT